MDVVFEISSFILAAGWVVTGILFVLQVLKIYATNDTGGVYWLTFAGFSFMQANATVYAYLSRNFLWLPGTIASTIACALIAWKAYRGHD